MNGSGEFNTLAWPIVAAGVIVSTRSTDKIKRSCPDARCKELSTKVLLERAMDLCLNLNAPAVDNVYALPLLD